MATRPARPQALTLTCIFVAVGCGLILVDLVGALQSWGSIALQDGVQEVLDEPPLAGSGLTIDRALDMLRYAAYVAVALSACGLVFAIYTLRGHRASRIMLTVLCVLAAVTFAAIGLVGLLPAVFASICAWTLWSAESRRWFDEMDGRVVASPDATVGDDQVPTPTGAQPPAAVVSDDAPAAATAPRAPTATTPGGSASGRPRPVQVAILLTAVSCSVVALFAVIAVLMGTVGADFARWTLEQPGLARDMLEDTGTTADEVVAGMTVGGVVMLALSVCGGLAAVAAARRRPAGRVALIVLSGVTVLATALSFPLGLVTAAAAVAVIVLLLRPEARDWYDSAA